MLQRENNTDTLKTCRDVQRPDSESNSSESGSHIYQKLLSKATYSNSFIQSHIDGADQHTRSSLGFSILLKDTSTCRPGELNQQPSDDKTLAQPLIHSHHLSPVLSSERSKKERAQLHIKTTKAEVIHPETSKDHISPDLSAALGSGLLPVPRVQTEPGPDLNQGLHIPAQGSIKYSDSDSDSKLT